MFSFLCKNNVQGYLHSVHKFEQVLLYSTSTKGVTRSLAKYLVNSLGFSEKEALSTSAKLKSHKVNDFKSCDTANSVVHFLKEHDFDDTHVRKIVSLHPRILFSKPNKTLQAKFKTLQDLGFSRSNLITVFSYDPTYVAKHMNDMLISNVRNVIGSDENMLKLFRKFSVFTTPGGLENLILNAEMLKNDCGVDIEVIRNKILQDPKPFLSNPEFFRDVVMRVGKELGITYDSKTFFCGILLSSRCSTESIESKRQVFKSFGWTEFQVSEILRRSPIVFLLDEQNIMKKLGFYLNELGYDPEYLAALPTLISCSLEKRIVPRHRVLLILKEKGLLDYNFYTASIKSEMKFLKLVKPFEDDVPGLLEIYHNSIRRPITDSLT